MSSMFTKFRKTGCALFFGAVLVTGCTPTNHVRGNILEDYQLAELRVGEDTQSDVLKKSAPRLPSRHLMITGGITSDRKPKNAGFLTKMLLKSALLSCRLMKAAL